MIANSMRDSFKRIPLDFQFELRRYQQRGCYENSPNPEGPTGRYRVVILIGSSIRSSLRSYEFSFATVDKHLFILTLRNASFKEVPFEKIDAHTKCAIRIGMDPKLAVVPRIGANVRFSRPGIVETC
jgi:hypothetical protein